MKKLTITAIGLTALLFSGCSLKNPFGIGYDTSVCNDSKTFGVCGSPKDIYKYKDKVKQVQEEYLNARLDTTLYFAVSPEGVVQVKADRDGKWERYDISEWKKIIDEKNKELKEKVSKESSKIASFDINSDIPVTKGGDLSVQYKKQGPLLVTRTKIGNIIRDQGLIQEVFIANYADTDGDLVSSHEVHIVARNPEWIVGERTPKDVRLEALPTPLSKDLLKKQQRVEKEQERTINAFNRDQEAGYLSAQEIESKNKDNKLEDLSIINKFIKEEK